MTGSIIEGLANVELAKIDRHLHEILNQKDHPGCYSRISQKMSVLVVWSSDLDTFSGQFEEILSLGFQEFWGYHLFTGNDGKFYGWGTFFLPPVSTNYQLVLNGFIAVFENRGIVCQYGKTHLEAETTDIGAMVDFTEAIYGVGHKLIDGIKPTKHNGGDNWKVKTKFKLSS